MNLGFWLSTTLAIPGFEDCHNDDSIFGGDTSFLSRVQCVWRYLEFLDQQFHRLSALEKQVMYCLAKSGVCDTTKVAGYCPNSLLSTITARVSATAIADWERSWYFYPTACNYGVHNWVKQLCGNFFRTTSFSRLLSINYILFRSNPLCLTLN